MMLALKSGPQIAAKVGNPAGLLCRRIWYSVVKSGVLGITEYRQGRPLYKCADFLKNLRGSVENITSLDMDWPLSNLCVISTNY